MSFAELLKIPYDLEIIIAYRLSVIVIIIGIKKGIKFRKDLGFNRTELIINEVFLILEIYFTAGWLFGQYLNDLLNLGAASKRFIKIFN